MRRALWLPALTVAVALLAAGAAGAGDHANACAFLRTPYTYEADQGRDTYIAALDAASVNALFPGDPFFGLPTIEIGTRSSRSDTAVRAIPATLLMAIGWVESDLTMAARAVPFESNGRSLVSFDCGYGIMQVTTGMTVPLGANNQPSGRQVSTATHYAFNVARGAAVLANKWNQAPQIRPIVGTDTNSNPSIIENWYYAVWSYNGFSGPGSNRSNHPLDPVFGTPRASYRCDGTQSRNRYPYQELAWGCMASPPSREGQQLWSAIPAALPDLSQPQYFQPLSITNFAFPYAGMDLPTPQPAHTAAAPVVAPSVRTNALGAPSLSVNEPTIVIRLNGTAEEARATIRVRNVGSGILSWVTSASDGWLLADPPAGVALGPEVSCGPATCDRIAEITITVNPVLLPEANTSGSLRISSPNGSGADVLLRVVVNADFEVGVPGTSRAY